ncbi:sushi, von Willebrand factor type A, EGF and pentraxin domain-containing 1-like [Paramuricea clavata]|uniref:Sushi, von Willebrand factor type A, EGF and pentraxin domain-containing 1-like, partial n=1 Tax=Paramuricea clavata TaxID=317549 RepID=A0A6S7FHA6_PARCT|nr:sushi, von Willebrand factor type A, EGF and pentraxin domain-containing 1-like [Paramuricea clavata]
MGRLHLFLVFVVLYLKSVESRDGGWSSWSGWSGCASGQCAGDQKIRTRTCTNPKPDANGAYCPGPNAERADCPVQCNCLLSGGWSEWGQWSICESICGGSVVNRTRRCENPAPKAGGSRCQGNSVETKLECAWPCETGPQDGGWGPWSHWSHCPKPCGLSPGVVITRTRRCNSPPPQNGGKACNGNATEEVLSCFEPCPVDGGLSAWTKWSPCSKTCNRGIQDRSRQCNSPFPNHGGRNCDGDVYQIQACKDRDCPGDRAGGWGPWSSLTPCTEPRYCYKGLQNRTRQCNNPPPLGNGDDCLGLAVETQQCPSPADNCADPSKVLPDEADTDRYESYIGLECETTKKYAVLGSFGHLLPAKILNDDFKDFANILRSGYFAKKVDGDDTKYCFEPQDTLLISQVVVKVKLYKVAPLLPSFDRPAETENVPGISITVDKNIAAKNIEFVCHIAKEYTPVTGFTLVNVLFSFYTEGIRYSFQAKGILTRIENTPFYSKVTQITGQLEATGHGATLAINELSDLAGFPVYQYPQSIQGALKAAGLLNIKLSPASFAYSMKTLSTFRVTGSLNIFGVPVHVEILTNPNKGVRIFAIGFSFDGESFGALSKRLSGYGISFLDVLGIDLQIGVSYAPAAQGVIKVTPEVNYAKQPLHSLIANAIPQDLFIAARVSLPKDCKGNGFCTGCKDLLGPDIAFILTGHIQKESIKVTAGFRDIKLTDDISFSKVQLFVEAKKNGSTNLFKLGFQVEVKIAVNKGIVVDRDGIKSPAPAIHVGGIIEWEITKNTIGGALYMSGLWRQAFGIKWLAIGEIVLGIKWVIGAPYPTGGYFGGKVQLGVDCWTAADFSNDGHCFYAQAYFGIGDPSFVYFKIAAITIGKIFRLVSPNLKLPPPIEDTGFPRGVTFSYASEAVDLRFFKGPNIIKGITFDGAVQILGYTIDAKIIVSEDYILADLKFDPIDWQGILTLSRSPTKKDLGPLFFLEYRKKPFYVNCRFEGFVSVLGISAYANMNLTMTEFQLLVQGNFLNLIKAEVYVAANYAPVFSLLKFYAKVTVDLSGLNKALDQAASAVKGAFDEAQRKLRGAQDHVKRKKEECKRKMSLKCDRCRDLKCKKAENDCKGFLDKAGKWIGGAINAVGNWVKNTAKTIGKALAPVGRFFKKIFSGWKRKREIERMRNELFEQHIRRRRFISKIICEGIVGGGCTAVSVLCEGSCRAVEFIGKGLCHILDVAVIALKAVELACGWISAAIQFVLTQLFRIHSIKFEFGIDNTVGGRITFAAAVDFTIFGKRLNLNVNINLRNPSAAVKETSTKALDDYKNKANPKSKSSTDEKVYDDPNPFSDFELSDQFMIENTQSGTEDEARSGACLYTPSKTKGAVLRLTACNENDERQMFSYNLKGLLVSAHSKLCVDTNGDKVGSVLRQTTCNIQTDNQRFECDLEVRTIKRRRTDLCWMTGETSIYGPGSLVQSSSYKCIHPNSGEKNVPEGTRLVMYSTCSESKIEFGLDDGYLLHTSGKCVKPVSGRITDGVELGLYDNCNGHKFGFTKGGSLKHLGSGKCIQPRDEADVPSDGSRLVLRGKCENNEANNRERYIFTWLPIDNHIELQQCTYFEQARLDQRFEVWDESLATVCSKFSKNLAEQRPTKQSSTAHNGFSSRAVDGKFSTAYSLKSCTHTNDETDPWWQVDLLQEYVITDVTILNRAQYGDRLKNFDVRIGSDSSNYQNNPTCHDRVGQARDNEAVRVQCKPPLPGRYVRVQMFGRGMLTMCEVLVYSRLGGYSDQCLLNNGGCDQICYNSCGRKVQCACGIGYKLAYDKKTCIDVNECLINNGGCQQTCINIPGERLCDCKSGFSLKENSETECEDYNECGLNNAGCEQVCKNTVGSYNCDCRKGFELHTNKAGCKDINECQTDNGDCQHQCHNYAGGYWCSCRNGYKLKADLHGCEEKLCPALVKPFRATLTPEICNNNRANIRRDTACSYSCQIGYQLTGGQTQRTCQIDGTFSGRSPYCKPLYCPKVQAPANGGVLPASCASNPSGSEFGQRCVFYCNSGYELRGPRYKSCQADQSWSEAMESTCERVYKNPWIVCPPYVEIELPADKSKIALGEQWRLPNSNMEKLVVHPSYLSNSYEFRAGKTLVTWTASNLEGSVKSCNYQVFVKDTTPPMISNCPADITQTTDFGLLPITWTEPTFSDNVGITNKLQTKTSGSQFKRGTTTKVHYFVFDAAGNSANCSFTVTIKSRTCVPMAPPKNGRLSGNSRYVRLVCNPGYSFEPTLPYPGTFICREGNFKMYLNREWTIFTRAPDCVATKPVNPDNSCDLGYIFVKSKNRCYPCETGLYHSIADKQCKRCPLNSYNDQQGVVSCQACPKGSVTLNTGSIQKSDCIVQCKPGSFSSNGLNDTTSPCEPCPIGTYQHKTASTLCMPCPQGMTTASTGSPALRDCAAPAKISETVPSSSLTAYVGEELTLECFVDGDPSPTVTVDRLGNPLASGSRVFRTPLLALDGKLIGMEVYIKVVQISDAGTYYCSTQNASGRDYRQFRVDVKAKTKRRSVDDL